MSTSSSILRRYQCIYNTEWLNWTDTEYDKKQLFNKKTMRLNFISANSLKIYSGSEKVYEGKNFIQDTGLHDMIIGNKNGKSAYNMTITGVRIYANQ
jgi:hypothetical protein